MDPHPHSTIPPIVQPVYLPETYSFAADAFEDMAQLFTDEGHTLTLWQRQRFTRIVTLYRRMALVQ